MEKIQDPGGIQVLSLTEEQNVEKMAKFLIETNFEVHSLKDWKFRVETTMEVSSPNDCKCKVKMTERN